MTTHATADGRMPTPPIAPADLVVLLAGLRGADAVREGVRRVVAGLRLLGDDLTALIVASSDIGSPGIDDSRIRLVTLDIDPLDRFPVITPAPRDAYRALFSTGRLAGARAMAVIAANGDQLTPATVRALVQPVIVDGFDVVAPDYERQVFDGLLNAAVVYPLTRALYGRRIHGQLGMDFCFSSRVAARWSTGSDDVKTVRPVWIIPQAVVDGLRVCQARLDARLVPASDSLDLGTLLAQVLGSLFADMEQRAAFWQRVQRSQPVPVFGAAPLRSTAGDAVDVRPMIESFVLAHRNLQSVWPLVLPPATLVELKKLTMTDAPRFRLADDLWARIIFDFALAHRLRTISRDHLLRALVPLYLAWIASYATEVRGATRQMAEVRLEQLCLAFETEKPYLVRRWRWPDRFNP